MIETDPLQPADRIFNPPLIPKQLRKGFGRNIPRRRLAPHHSMGFPHDRRKVLSEGDQPCD
ncbi:MAG: hypothetical protein NTV52_28525 [Acidobacteria bacterium]|nr:hypothetical protein [Acidobacteriota bacterium]